MMAVKKKTAKKAPAKKRPAARKTLKAKTTRATAKKPAGKVARTAAKKPVKKVIKKTAQKAPSNTTAYAAPLNPVKEMEKIMTQQPFQYDQLAQDAANQSREGVEAFVKSGTIFAKGFEDIIKTAASITQGAAEKQAEYAKQLMSSKTLNEFAEAQNKIAQANFDQFMAGATKLSEMSVKVLSEASEPLNAQITKTVNKASKKMAA